VQAMLDNIKEAYFNKKIIDFSIKQRKVDGKLICKKIMMTSLTDHIVLNDSDMHTYTADCWWTI
jgi:hypothetical protein